MSLLWISGEDKTKEILFIYLFSLCSLTCQSVNLSWKIVAQNAGYVFVYICGGHKNNLRLWFCSSFNAKLILDYFSVNFNVLVAVFCQQFKKKLAIPIKIGGKIRQGLLTFTEKFLGSNLLYISLPIYQLHFRKFCSIPKQ